MKQKNKEMKQKNKEMKQRNKKRKERNNNSMSMEEEPSIIVVQNTSTTQMLSNSCQNSQYENSFITQTSTQQTESQAEISFDMDKLEDCSKIYNDIEE